MDIVIIDDGVNDGFFKLKPLRYDLEINEQQKISNRQNKNELICSHGTICAAIILKYSPDAVISSIKVLDSTDGRGKRDHLVLALQWCLKNHVKLINLSIGTTYPQNFKEIRSVISKLYRNGCIIVSAYNNENTYTMPASLECTIGVKCNPALEDGGCQVCESEFECFVEAAGRHELINSRHKKFESQSANSFATPYVTAIVYHLIAENNCCDLADIYTMLSQNKKSFLYHVPDSIEQAIVIDLTGCEMIELFYFSVVKIYNCKTIHEIKKINDFVNIVILAKDNFCMEPLMKVFKSIDKYIRGIFCCFRSDNVDFAEKDNLYNRIWWERYYIKRFAGVDCKLNKVKEILMYHDVDRRDYNYRKKKISVPLVYIYGAKKELIRLLLNLEEKFLRDGYVVKVIGEFQCAYLYGFEYIDCDENRISVIHSVNNRFCPDIIICGINSRIISHDEEDMCLDLEIEKQAYMPEKNSAHYSEIIYSKIISSFE